MAEAVVSFALERIGYLLALEYNLLSGVEDNVKDLEKELKLMHGFLKNADERKDEDENVKTCVSEIKDLAFRIENVLESFVIQEKEGFRRIFGMICECIPRHQVGSEIRKIQNDIRNLTIRLERYKIIDSSKGASASTVSQREVLVRKSYPHLIEEDFVGMVNDEEQLVSHLMSMDKHDAVITITGMGGQGKTTMATRLYNRKDVRGKFTNFAWFCVTQTIQTKTIWQDILKQLCPEKKAEVMEMGDTELVGELYKIQQEKKCIIVLDDIWTTEDWLSLRPGFPVGGTIVGSKLVLTTRKLDAKVGRVHVLGCLDDDEAWLLLQKKAFPENEGNHEFRIQMEMEKIGRDIVKKCEKLPLAISVLGGILKDKSNLEEWEMLSRNISKYLRKGEGMEEDENSIIHVLGLSYKELPYYLKPCFLYFACFPEDSEISIEKICLLWSAEGFVYSSHIGEGEITVGVARQYLNELAQRSMLILIHNKYTGSVKKCRLHDLMREMCIFQGKKDDFLTVIHQDSEEDPRFVHPHYLYPRRLVFSPDSCSRRLALSFDNFESVKIPRNQHDAVMHIGSLILRGTGSGEFKFKPIAVEAPGIGEFRFLRALQVQGRLYFQYEDLKRISKLIHLRLLIFKGCNVSRFPSCISTLRYLETLVLKVGNGYDDVIIPNSLGRMKQLRHLFLPERYKVEGGEKLRLDGLVNLEILSGVKMPTTCNVEDIGKLNRLGILRAHFGEGGSGEDMRCLIENMNIAASHCHLRNTTLIIYSSIFSWEDSTLSHLQDLFYCLALQDLTIIGQINKLPEPNPHHQLTSSLTTIELEFSKLKEDPMKTLEKLPNLQTLKLRFDSFVGEEMVCSTEGFPQLKTLKLLELSIKKWEVEDGAMPMLHFLVIGYCYDLEMIPDGFRFLKALKQLKIRRMHNIKKRVGVEGEDFEKVQHVPSITYTYH